MDGFLNASDQDTAENFSNDVMLRLALKNASPSTFESLKSAQGRDISPKLRRTLRKYWTRAHTRATPFGLFSAVGVTKIGNGGIPKISRASSAKVSAYFDMDWLARAVRNTLSGNKKEGSVSTVRANPFIFRTNERKNIPYNGVIGEGEANQVSVRATRPVIELLNLVEKFYTIDELYEFLDLTYPHVDEVERSGLVEALVNNNVIIQDVLLPSSGDIPSEVLDLNENIANLAVDISEISEIYELEGKYDSLVARQDEVLPDYIGSTLGIDASVSIEYESFDERVADDIARLTTVLSAIGTPFARFPHLVEYESRFVERFGCMAEIPVLELLDSVLGIGAPPTYTNPAPDTLWQDNANASNSERDSILWNLLLSALLERKKTVSLTPETLKALENSVDRTCSVRPPSMDVCVSLIGNSDADSNGAYTYLVKDMLCDGGRSFGRFSRLFDDDQKSAFNEPFEFENEFFSLERTVQLRYHSSSARTANVSRTDNIADLELAVNCSPELPSARQVDLQDILVGSAGDGFYLRWAKSGERIRIIQNHVLNPLLAPNAIRFLLEASRDGVEPVSGFDWGSAGQCPFLPRVQFENFVLAPAKWCIAKESFTEAAMLNQTYFAIEFKKIRSALEIPDVVLLSDNDNKLLLHLDSPQDLDIIYALLSRDNGENTQIVFEESFEGELHCGIEDSMGNRYAAEYVFTTVLEQKSQENSYSSNSAKSHLLPMTKSRTDLAKRPNEEWLSLELYTTEASTGRLLGEIEQIITRLGKLVDSWFFIRYVESGYHLRLRVRPSVDSENDTLIQLLEWADRMVACDLLSRRVLRHVNLEVNRYGGPECISLAIEVFQASSSLAIALSKNTAFGDLDRDSLCAFLTFETLKHNSSIEDLIARAGDIPSRHPARMKLRKIRKQLGALIEPGGYDEDEVSDAFLKNYVECSAAYMETIKHLWGTLKESAMNGSSVMTPSAVMESVTHMHLNRCIGPSYEEEAEGQVLLSLILSSNRRRSSALMSSHAEDR
ncbi:lantibiotic dehydratase [Corynebacterium casei]|uniref:lantibiotic dehydratase n=1 Tax=Corynebacterium casei TaxID=160386 RepID=UPI003FD40E32